MTIPYADSLFNLAQQNHNGAQIANGTDISVQNVENSVNNSIIFRYDPVLIVKKLAEINWGAEFRGDSHSASMQLIAAIQLARQTVEKTFKKLSERNRELQSKHYELIGRSSGIKNLNPNRNVNDASAFVIQSLESDKLLLLKEVGMCRADLLQLTSALQEKSSKVVFLEAQLQDQSSKVIVLEAQSKINKQEKSQEVSKLHKSLQQAENLLEEQKERISSLEKKNVDNNLVIEKKEEETKTLKERLRIKEESLDVIGNVIGKKEGETKTLKERLRIKEESFVLLERKISKLEKNLKESKEKEKRTGSLHQKFAAEIQRKQGL